MKELRLETIEGDSFAGSFYDLDTSASFCAYSVRVEAQAHTKSGKEAYCLGRLLRQDGWRDELENTAVNLVDLGTGSGGKAVQVIRALASAHARPINFFPVDASAYCAAFSIITALTASRGVTSAALEGLFDEPPAILRELPSQALGSVRGEVAMHMTTHEPGTPTVSQGDLTVLSRGVPANFMRDTSEVIATVRNSPGYVDGVTVVAVLGQTVGNYSHAERRDFLSRLHAEMKDGDLLLIDAGIRPEEGDPADLGDRLRNLERAYRREAETFMRHKADHPRSRFQIAYDPGTHQMNHWFERPDGSAQYLGYSYLFTRTELIELLDAAGYRIVTSVLSLDDPALRPGPECVVVLAEKAVAEQAPARGRRGRG